jgi:UDPglucose 6-dehydrogenase
VGSGVTVTTVGVLGLGKLGLPLALTFAEAGHRVLTWDVDDVARQAVIDKVMHIDEVHVPELLQAYPLELVPPSFIAEMADIVFVIVPTPSIADGSFDDSYVRNAITSLIGARGHGPIVSVISTLSPGSCRRLAQFAHAHDMQFVYTPTMIALGSVVHDLREAEMQIVGHGPSHNDRRSGLLAAAVMKSVAGNTPQAFMSYESAEITKIASNAFSTLKIAFFNTLGQICGEVPGADVDEVCDGLRLRGHIGTKLTTPGAGFGGPCFPRDTSAFAAIGHSERHELGHIIHELNEDHVRYVSRMAVDLRPDARTFAILGREYKDGSNYRIESFGDQLAEQLTKYGLTAVASIDADVVIIAMPLKKIDLCGKIHHKSVVIDLWRTHGYLAECPHVTYVPFGTGPKIEEEFK